MTKTSTRWVLLTLLGIVILAGGIYWISKPKQTAAPTKSSDQVQNGQPEPGSSAPGQQPAAGNTMEGVLKASDSPKKGNLMLVTKERTLYIFTSRDYSGLIGKQVVVSYDGTIEEFRLGDIQPKDNIQPKE